MTYRDEIWECIIYMMDTMNIINIGISLKK